MSTHMASVNIAIKEEAYNFLKSLKGTDRSFSEVILELKERKNIGTSKKMMRFFGALKNSGIDWDSKEKRMMDFRESINKRLGKKQDDRA